MESLGKSALFVVFFSPSLNIRLPLNEVLGEGSKQSSEAASKEGRQTGNEVSVSDK